MAPSPRIPTFLRALLDPRRAIDLIALSLAFLAAYTLRFDLTWPEESLRLIPTQLLLSVLTQCAFLHLFGGYRLLWRLITLGDIGLFAKAAVGAFATLALLRLLLPPSLPAWRVPLGISFVSTLIGFGGLLGLRLLRRTANEKATRRAYPALPGRKPRPVLLVGAGQAGIIAAMELKDRGGMNLEILGFVDDDPNKVGRLVQGVPVLGTTADLPGLCTRLKADHVIVTIARIGREDLDRIVRICHQVPIKVRIIPCLHELFSGQVEVIRIRDVRIEDLLGRDPVALDEQRIAGFLSGRKVLVTGAGGSIGSELCRQVARFGADCLLLVERVEGALFQIEQDLRAGRRTTQVVPLLADIADQARMGWILRHFRPDVLVHAAAHKHVYMMERNPAEALKNNVLATRRLAEQTIEHGVDCFLQISTDKAVRPTSVMGASKRLAELAVQSLTGSSSTRFISVRFGNVLGSAGSVIPIFHKQILAGGPVTVTHPDMVRFFMTIPEAVQLTLQAGAMGQGGEIFVLDMGAPVKILDLARQMIRLMGFKPDEEIQIAFSGARPGEKLFEELGSDCENLERTEHPKIFRGRIRRDPPDQVAALLARLTDLAQEGPEDALRMFLNEALPEARVGCAV